MSNNSIYIKNILIIILMIFTVSACNHIEGNDTGNLVEDDKIKSTTRFYTTEENIKNEEIGINKENNIEKESNNSTEESKIESETETDTEINESDKSETTNELETLPNESRAETTKTSDNKKQSKKKNSSPIPKEDEAVEADYFDDVVFVGDSVSQGFRDYVEWKKEELNVDYVGEAKFLTALNFGIRNALLGKKLPLYKGEQIPIEDAIAQMDVKKVYILLGMNDIATFEINKIVEYYEELIDNILLQNPDLKIFIQSVTPLTRTENTNQTQTNFRQKRVDELNDKLFDMAKEKDYYYLDIASVVKDEEGFLPNEYSYRETCHMRPDALELWIHYLRTHTI